MKNDVKELYLERQWTCRETMTEEGMSQWQRGIEAMIEGGTGCRNRLAFSEISAEGRVRHRARGVSSRSDSDDAVYLTPVS